MPEGLGIHNCGFPGPWAFNRADNGAAQDTDNGAAQDMIRGDEQGNSLERVGEVVGTSWATRWNELGNSLERVGRIVRTGGVLCRAVIGAEERILRENPLRRSDGKYDIMYVVVEYSL